MVYPFFLLFIWPGFSVLLHSSGSRWLSSLHTSTDSHGNVQQHTQIILHGGHFSSAHIYIYIYIHFLPVSFALDKGSRPRMLWQFEAENLSSHSVPRMREFLLRLPLRKNGPCPLICRLSREEGPLKHLELTSCALRPVSSLCIILLYLINHVPFGAFSCISDVVILICSCWFFLPRTLFCDYAQGENWPAYHINVSDSCLKKFLTHLEEYN